jgi:hypothetical protein
MAIAISFFDLLMLIIFICVAPFVAWGLFSLMTLISTILKVRRGNIRIWKTLPNDQVVKFWARPEGGKIKIKSRNPGGILKESTIEVELGKGWIWREGAVPFILLDKDNIQVPWKVNFVGEGVPKEIVDEIADTAYQSGVMVGFANLNNIKQIMIFVLIAIIVGGIGIFLNYYFWVNVHVVTQVVNIVASNTTTTI